MSGPHLTHATVVFNFSDGSRHAYLMGGGPCTEVEIETEANIEEIRGLNACDPVALRTVSWDVTFRITGITDYRPQAPTQPAELAVLPRQVEP